MQSIVFKKEFNIRCLRMLALALVLAFLGSFAGRLWNMAPTLALEELDPVLFNYPTKFDDWEEGETKPVTVNLGELEWSIRQR